MRFIRVKVCSQTWLVPPLLVTEDFRWAAIKLTVSSHLIRPVELTDKELEALKTVNEHPEVWKL